MDKFLASLIFIFTYGATALGIFAGLISPLISFKQKSFAIHSMAHIVLLSNVLASLLKLSTPFYLETFVNILFCNFCSYLEEKKFSSSYLLILANFFSALGMLLMEKKISKVFYGSFWLISLKDIRTLWLLSILLAIFLFFYGKKFILVSIDPSLYSYAYSIPKNWMNFVFCSFLGCAMTVISKMVGFFLISSLLVSPGCIAIKWCSGLRNIFIMSVLTSVTVSLLSLIGSLYYNVPFGVGVSLNFFLLYLISICLKRFEIVV